MKQKLILLFSLLCSVFLLFSCSSDDESGDVSTRVTLYVSDKTGIYQGEGLPCEGLLIREEGETTWQCVLPSDIEGFSYEKGTAYRLEVVKTVLAHPMADASSVVYKLISQQVVEDTSNW